MTDLTRATPRTGTASACEGCENPAGAVRSFLGTDREGRVALVRYCEDCADIVRAGQGDWIVAIRPADGPLTGEMTMTYASIAVRNRQARYDSVFPDGHMRFAVCRGGRTGTHFHMCTISSARTDCGVRAAIRVDPMTVPDSALCEKCFPGAGEREGA